MSSPAPSTPPASSMSEIASLLKEIGQELDVDTTVYVKMFETELYRSIANLREDTEWHNFNNSHKFDAPVPTKILAKLKQRVAAACAGFEGHQPFCLVCKCPRDLHKVEEKNVSSNASPNKSTSPGPGISSGRPPRPKSKSKRMRARHHRQNSNTDKERDRELRSTVPARRELNEEQVVHSDDLLAQPGESGRRREVASESFSDSASVQDDASAEADTDADTEVAEAIEGATNRIKTLDGMESPGGQDKPSFDGLTKPEGLLAPPESRLSISRGRSPSGARSRTVSTPIVPSASPGSRSPLTPSPTTVNHSSGTSPTQQPQPLFTDNATNLHVIVPDPKRRSDPSQNMSDFIRSSFAKYGPSPGTATAAEGRSMGARTVVRSNTMHVYPSSTPVPIPTTANSNRRQPPQPSPPQPSPPSSLRLMSPMESFVQQQQLQQLHEQQVIQQQQLSRTPPSTLPPSIGKSQPSRRSPRSARNGDHRQRAGAPSAKRLSRGSGSGGESSVASGAEAEPDAGESENDSDDSGAHDPQRFRRSPVKLTHRGGGSGDNTSNNNSDNEQSMSQRGPHQLQPSLTQTSFSGPMAFTPLTVSNSNYFAAPPANSSSSGRLVKTAVNDKTGLSSAPHQPVLKRPSADKTPLSSAPSDSDMSGRRTLPKPLLFTPSNLPAKYQIEHPNYHIGLTLTAPPTRSADKGVLVLESEGPARDGGVRPGDIITAIAGQPTGDSHAFMSAFRHFESGDQLSFELIREGKPLTVWVTVGDKKEYRQQQQQAGEADTLANSNSSSTNTTGSMAAEARVVWEGMIPSFGLAHNPAAAAAAASGSNGSGASSDLKPVAGLVISEVKSNGPASRAGLRRGDSIVTVNGVPTPNEAAFRGVAHDTRPGEVVPFQVLRDGKSLILDVTVGARGFSLEKVCEIRAVALGQPLSVSSNPPSQPRISPPSTLHSPLSPQASQSKGNLKRQASEKSAEGKQFSSGPSSQVNIGKTGMGLFGRKTVKQTVAAINASNSPPTATNAVASPNRNKPGATSPVNSAASPSTKASKTPTPPPTSTSSTSQAGTQSAPGTPIKSSTLSPIPSASKGRSVTSSPAKPILSITSTPSSTTSVSIESGVNSPPTSSILGGSFSPGSAHADPSSPSSNLLSRQPTHSSSRRQLFVGPALPPPMLSASSSNTPVSASSSPRGPTNPIQLQLQLVDDNLSHRPGGISLASSANSSPASTLVMPLQLSPGGSDSAASTPSFQEVIRSEAVRRMMKGRVFTGYFENRGKGAPIKQDLLIFYSPTSDINRTVEQGGASSAALSASTGSTSSQLTDSNSPGTVHDIPGSSSPGGGINANMQDLGCLYWSSPSKRVPARECCLPLSQIAHVYMGKQTKVFKMSFCNDAVAQRCFSIVSKDKTHVNFEAESARELSVWLYGINLILTASGKKVIKHRNSTTTAPFALTGSGVFSADNGSSLSTPTPGNATLPTSTGMLPPQLPFRPSGPDSLSNKPQSSAVPPIVISSLTRPSQGQTVSEIPKPSPPRDASNAFSPVSPPVAAVEPNKIKPRLLGESSAVVSPQRSAPSRVSASSASSTSSVSSASSPPGRRPPPQAVAAPMLPGALAALASISRESGSSTAHALTAPATPVTGPGAATHDTRKRNNPLMQRRGREAAPRDSLDEFITDEGARPIDPNTMFSVISKIGEGSFGSVFKALDKRTNEIVAVKIIDKLDAHNKLKEEIEILKKCNCPNIVAYKGTYRYGRQIWIVMEYCGAGSFCDLMAICDRTLSEKQIAAVLKMSLLGLDYLHRQNKIHRDIKAGNILINDAGCCKLADFGVAAQLTKNVPMRRTVIGTPYWMAPEVLMANQEYNGKVDVWSLAITAIELACGDPPMSNLHPMRAIFLIPTSPAPTLPDPSKWSSEFNDFVRVCLEKDSSRRPSAQELLDSHPFIVNAPGEAAVRELVQECMEDIEDYRNLENRIQRDRANGSTFDSDYSVSDSEAISAASTTHSTMAANDDGPVGFDALVESGLVDSSTVDEWKAAVASREPRSPQNNNSAGYHKRKKSSLPRHGQGLFLHDPSLSNLILANNPAPTVTPVVLPSKEADAKADHTIPDSPLWMAIRQKRLRKQRMSYTYNDYDNVDIAHVAASLSITASTATSSATTSSSGLPASSSALAAAQLPPASLGTAAASVAWPRFATATVNLSGMVSQTMTRLLRYQQQQRNVARARTYATVSTLPRITWPPNAQASTPPASASVRGGMGSSTVPVPSRDSGSEEVLPGTSSSDGVSLYYKSGAYPHVSSDATLDELKSSLQHMDVAFKQEVGMLKSSYSSKRFELRKLLDAAATSGISSMDRSDVSQGRLHSGDVPTPTSEYDISRESSAQSTRPVSLVNSPLLRAHASSHARGPGAPDELPLILATPSRQPPMMPFLPAFSLTPDEKEETGEIW